MTPRISVIVPVHAQWELVPGLLAALAAQTLARDAFEVVVVNNDAPAPAPALPGPHRVVDCPAPGSYAARNAGAAAARGRLLAFTDADCLPEPGWLAALEAAASRSEPEQVLLAGQVTLVSSARPNRYELFDMIRGIPQARYVRNGYAATANLMVPAMVFRALGGFDALRFSGGDAEFCWRAGAAGHPIRLVPEAAVLHPARSRWDELAAKTRRMTGGQVGAGTPARRLLWFLRALTPPLRTLWRFALAAAPAGHRLAAIRVLFALWLVELDEALRIVFTGKAPERR